MRDINKILPKLPKNYFGALLNFVPNKAEANEILKTFPYDSKWHTLLQDTNSMIIDGRIIRKQNAERFT